MTTQKGGPENDAPPAGVLAIVDQPTAAAPRHEALAVLASSFRYQRTKLGMALTLGIVGLALVGPYLARYSPTQFVGAPYATPSQALPLGADYLGHDVLTEVLYGGRSILWMAFAAICLGLALGVGLGMIAGYSRGLVDDLIMRTLDLQLGFPGLVFVLLFVSMLGHHLWLIVLLVGLGHVPGVSRVVRGMTMELATHDFVAAAEALAVPRRRILLREVLPNLTTPLFVEFTLRLTWAIAAMAAISFLGFGVQPPSTDWGLMINQNRNGLTIEPWAVAIPVLCIALFTVGTNLIGEGMSRAVAGIDRPVLR